MTEAAAGPRKYDWGAWRLPASIIAGAALVAGVVGTLLTLQTSRFTAIEARIQAADEKIDRRVDALENRIGGITQRIDTVIGNQGTASVQLGRLETELAYIRARLDRVAERLQVSAVPTEAPTAGVPRTGSGTATGQGGQGPSTAPARNESGGQPMQMAPFKTRP